MGFSHSRQLKTKETSHLFLPRLRQKQARLMSHQLFGFWIALKATAWQCFRASVLKRLSF